MTAIETLVRQPIGQAVGWALLQFVWQGALVGAVSALALLALRRSASDVRYVVAAIGLALMLTLPVVSGVQKFQALRTDAGAGDLPAAAFARADGQTRASAQSSAQPRGWTADPTAYASLSGASTARHSIQDEPHLPTFVITW